VNRWIVLLGRGGTILIAIGCASLLVSLIPSAKVGSFSGSGVATGKTWYWPYEHVLTPQQCLSVSISANGTLKAYLLEVSFQTIYNWIKETHPQSPGSEPFQYWNETYLIEFMTANSQTVAIQKEIIDGEASLEYTPTKITNITLVVHNPNPSFVKYNCEGSVLLTMAPKITVQTLSQTTIPLGFFLTIPWIINTYKMRKEKQTQH
jgi:hypothetical protein